MIYNLQNFVFIYVIVVIYSSHVFAPWTAPIVPPLLGTKLQCYYWLIHHGFSDDGHRNQELARGRAKQYDKDVSYFAAGYAYFLSNDSELYDINRFSPSEYCGMYTMNYVKYPYITTKDAEFTCEGWIDFYLYNKGRDNYRSPNYMQMHPDNRIWARKRDRSMDNKISLWALRFFQFIINHRNENTTPSMFCSSLGQPVLTVPYPRHFPFMTIDGSRMSCIEWNEMNELEQLAENVVANNDLKNVTKLPFMTSEATMTCHEWIKLSGFSCALDHNIHNYQLIMSGHLNMGIINTMTKQFIKYVLEQKNLYNDHQIYRQNQLAELNNTLENAIQNGADEETINNLMTFRDYIQNQVEHPAYFVDYLMSPIQFCQSESRPDTVQLDYFGNLLQSF